MAVNIFVKAKTFLLAIGRVLRRIAMLQNPGVGVLVRHARARACQTCEFRVGKTCDICGCLLYAKIRLRDEQCPIGMWSKL